MIYSKLYVNPLNEFHDCRTAFLDIIEPYKALVSPGKAWVEPGPPGATFGYKAVCLEGFARLLWGLVPYLAGGGIYKKWDNVLTGLSNGVDPDHQEYWGTPGDYDQLLVEMAVFGYALCLIPDKIWSPLSEKAKNNFSRWISYINLRKIPDCNWVFFRILINLGLKKTGADGFDQNLLDQSLDLVDHFYIGDGWYNDGFTGKKRARDYYIPWAFHYYSLIISECCREELPNRADVYRDRAVLFAKDYIYWFAGDGSALPFGRSLTYRYAAAGFWGALAFANCEALPWGVIKGIYLRHMRWWFRKPFFSETGLQSVGYCYPNLHMAERYNSPNSPLWALKAFIPLAISEYHPFWKAEEVVLPKEKDIHMQKHTGFLISDTKESGHLYALNAGQWTPGESNEHNHMAEKYSKFAYSNYFGFNVSTDAIGIDKLGHDNMLLIGTGDRFYRYRMETTDHYISKEYISSIWKPFFGGTVTTYLAISGAWSVRLHHIVSDIWISTVEGGFALPFGDESYPLPESLHNITDTEAYWTSNFGFSGIRNITGNRKGRVIVANPNANIMHEHTFIPSLLSDYLPGEHWIGCAVLAHPVADEGKEIWNRPKDLTQIVENLKNIKQ